MKTLILLRHAESSAGDASLGDHDRPLNRRGRDAARRVGRHLCDADAAPDLVLCSSALRAQETAERVLAEIEARPPTEVEGSLYLANPERLIQRIASVPDDCDSLLVIAHNPGIADLALRLAASGSPEIEARMQEGFPAAALVRLRLASPSWGQIESGGEISAFVVPSELEP